MDGNIIKEHFSGVQKIDKSEVIRYLGGANAEISPEADALLNRGIDLINGVCDCRACYLILPVCLSDGTADFGLFQVESRDLCAALSGCARAVIFAATIGIGTDNLIRRHSITEPSLAAVLQAAGSAAVESFCDELCAKISETHPLRPRFSPGYGDLPLSTQKDIFRVLDCPKNAGITLTDGLLMIPSKSVTAIAGISTDAAALPCIQNCVRCDFSAECNFKRN